MICIIYIHQTYLQEKEVSLLNKKEILSGIKTSQEIANKKLGHLNRSQKIIRKSLKKIKQEHEELMAERVLVVDSSSTNLCGIDSLMFGISM